MKALLCSLMNSLVESVWIDGTRFGLLISFHTKDPESTSCTCLMINHFCCQHLPPGLWLQRVRHTRMCRMLMLTRLKGKKKKSKPILKVVSVSGILYIFYFLFLASSENIFLLEKDWIFITIFCWFFPPEKSQHQDAEVTVYKTKKLSIALKLLITPFIIRILTGTIQILVLV